MSANDWNDKIIAEFRANAGRVGEPFEGDPIVLVHHTGRKSGLPRISPMMYLAGPGDTIYVFASKGGAPDHPDWYYNLTSSGTGAVEVGTQSWDVVVEELAGERREAVYARVARAYPVFAEYAAKLDGHRTIPVLALTRR